MAGAGAGYRGCSGAQFRVPSGNASRSAPSALLDDAVRRAARDAGRASPLAELMLVEAVREVAERESGRRIGPGDLPTAAVVAERARRDRAAHPSRPRASVVSCDVEAGRAVSGRSR